MSKDGGANGKPYGSGYFGSWIEDVCGLPAFKYTCDQTSDPKAVTPVGPGLLTETDHVHQIGNDRIVGIASNNGWVQVRQDEGAPKLLNSVDHSRHQHGGGIGYLISGREVLSTYYRSQDARFERTFGVGYFRKQVGNDRHAIDQIIFAPFGDDPVLLSQVTITNRSLSVSDLRWIEYWGCQAYELSFKLYMLSHGLQTPVQELRRRFAAQFSHRFSRLEDGSGLLEQKDFIGPDADLEREWERLKPVLAANPTMFAGGAVSEPADERVAFDDLAPPATFLASLDAAPSAASADGAAFFGEGSALSPASAVLPIKDNLDVRGAGACLLLERQLSLRPGESKTLHFMYGYLPTGSDSKALIQKYRAKASSAFKDSSEQWRRSALKFRVDSEPWIARETTWNYYYVRSNRTFDSYFQEHIISQAAQYTYVMGNQSSMRDPLQHALPFIFSDPEITKEVLRYALKSMRRDGSIPYGIVGHGMPMPTVMDNASDIPLWLLWAASEYVLATRDMAFLLEEIPTYPLYGPTSERVTVRDLLDRTYRYLIEKVGTGKHNLMRMLEDDWNDAVITLWVPKANRAECVATGESVSNSAMAAYVFSHYARMLSAGGRLSNRVAAAYLKADEHRAAVRTQWCGEWFRRAWLGSKTGWLGERNLWLEPQPWAILGATCTRAQLAILISSIQRMLQEPSPIGAMQQAGAGETLADGAVRPAGMSVNGGIWPSLNMTLVWALAQSQSPSAWIEWKKNSLATHAHVYPDVWYGTWSGLDSVNSAINERAGRASKSRVFNQEDFPVMNMHSHACSLFGIPKLLGIEFTSTGVRIAPQLPVDSFAFESPLLGIIKTVDRYNGWYAPATEGDWHLELSLSAEEARRFTWVEVNGSVKKLELADSGVVSLRGTGSKNQPLTWAVRC